MMRPVDATRRQRILEARQRLLRVLADLGGAISEQALVRCPYRTREDTCTFRGACRNQIAHERALRRCNGGALDARPASRADIEAAST